MTATWFGAAPELLLILVVLVAPGLLAARCLRFGWWDAVGLSVPLSLGIAAIADEGAAESGVRWGLPVIVGATLVIAAVCWFVAGYFAKRHGADEDATKVEGSRWGRREHIIAALATVAAACLGGFAVARGIGTPHAIDQLWDAIFHVNAINQVAHHHSAAPSVVSHANNPSATGFYPPLFAGIAALSTIYGGVNPIVAANVASVAIAVVWPLTISLALRRIARPGVFGYSMAMLGAVTVALFPALVLQYGTLWPNALSLLAVAPALVLCVRILGLDRTRDGADDPHGRLAWWPTVGALVLLLPGVVFAQPSSIFAIYYLSTPMLIWFLWRRLVNPDAVKSRQVLVAAAAVLGVGLVSIGLIWLSYRNASIAAVGHFYWPKNGSILAAVRRVLELNSMRSLPNIGFGVLAVVGLVVGLRHARGRFLAMGYLILAVLYIFAFAIQDSLTMRLTGYWYNDAYRLISMMPLVVLPLAALGADALFGLLRAVLTRALTSRDSAEESRSSVVATVSAVVILGVVLALQGGLGTSKVSKTVATAYVFDRNELVTPLQAAMLKRLRHEVPAGFAIAGDPFRGESLAGVLSGHPAIYTSLQRPTGADRVLVASSFVNYRTDPAVCAAVKRLKIAVVVTGPVPRRENGTSNTGRRAPWVGFNDMNTIPGLTLIDQGGGAAAYRVGPCKS